MKAVIFHRYGSPDELTLTDVEKPVPTADQILIKIHAVSINGSDREKLAGRPLYVRFDGPFKPGRQILGSDIAGVVEAAGQNITDFKPGDAVFGEIPGYHSGFAEYVVTSGRTMLPKPNELTFGEAAAVPQGGVIAYQGIIEKGRVGTGQQVLINGAGGSAGVFAVQLAKNAGAEVTAVDNAGKLDFLRTLGANHVVDYRREEFTRSGRQYDLILDLIAHRSPFAIRHALRPGGSYFFVGGSLGKLFQILLLGPLLKRLTDKRFNLLAVPQNREDLKSITQLILGGEVKPIIDRTFSLEQTPDAMRYVSEGRALGKVVINVE